MNYSLEQLRAITDDLPNLSPEVREALRNVVKDAERYRYLRANTEMRDRGYGPSGMWLEIAEGLPWGSIEGATDEEMIDAAIDAAIGETAK